MYAPDMDHEGRNPPPPPRWVHPPARGRRFTILVLCGVLLGLLAGVGLLVLQFVEGNDAPHAIHEAERFVGFICLGEAGDPADGNAPDVLCGYAKAYDMLSEDLRARLSYGAFCGEFVVIAERSGSIQRLEKVASSRARRRRDGRYSYLLYFGHEDADLEDLTVFSLEMSIGWQDSRWVVSRFAIHPASHREVR